MRHYDQCRKCGNLVNVQFLTSVLYDDPTYAICETCLNLEDYSDNE